jgi:L-fuculose-phosphate aldolase
MPNKPKILRNQIIYIGKKLCRLGLVAGRAGNLSARLDKNNLLITATGRALSNLKYSDILQVSFTEKKEAKAKPVSSEFPLHSLIYQNFATKAVIHCHPPLTNAYFAMYPSIKPLTLETKFYLGEIPVVKQKTPTVTRPKAVIAALKKAKLVVLKNHGVVAVGEDFVSALTLIETLESAVKVVAVARLLQQNKPNPLNKQLKKYLI